MELTRQLDQPSVNLREPMRSEDGVLVPDGGEERFSLVALLGVDPGIILACFENARGIAHINYAEERSVTDLEAELIGHTLESHDAEELDLGGTENLREDVAVDITCILTGEGQETTG